MCLCCTYLALFQCYTTSLITNNSTSNQKLPSSIFQLTDFVTHATKFIEQIESISFQNMCMFLCSKYSILQSGLKLIDNAILLYMQPIPLLWWHFAVNGSCEQREHEQITSVTLPLWTRAMPRYIRFPTTVDFSGIFGGVWWS